MSAQAKTKDEIESQTPILSARGVYKSYGQVTAIDGADFELYPGEILAVIGDNGAGKSSLIKVLSGATIPDKGTISLDGEEVHFKIAARRARAQASRRSTRTSRWPRRSTSRPTCSSVARSAGRAPWGAFCAWSTTRARRRRPRSR